MNTKDNTHRDYSISPNSDGQKDISTNSYASSMKYAEHVQAQFNNLS